jgi:carboxylesterase type B
MSWALQVLLFCSIANVAIAFLFPGVPIVRVPEYTAIGFKNTTVKGTSANLYFGLPYAKPPVGNLRFEKPEPLSPSLLKVVKATSWPKACHQVVDATSMGIHSSEDCLYLNVMTPTKPSHKLRPVLVFIHGGGYEYGYTEEYGFQYFVDNFVSQDLVMVTLQYRLAHLGFFATRDHEINGNFGHFDQLEALRFVKRNIRAFGGDPNRITLAGHSAGSVSVHTLSLSPKTKNLYNQEIHIAGSNYAKWPIDNDIVYNQSDIISTAVGCNQVNTKARKVCLKKVPNEKFWQARIDLGLPDFPTSQIDILYWTSVFDNDFFGGKKLDQLQREAPRRKTLYGVDAGEGLLWTLYTNNPITNVFAIGRGFSPENRTTANLDTIKNFLPQLLTDARFTPAIKQNVINDILEFYKIGDQYNTYPLYYFDKYTELYSDLIMKVPTSKEIEAKLQMNWPDQYMFVFNYTRPIDRPIIGDLPGHGYFLMYFAGLEIYTFNGLTHTAVDNELQTQLSEMFVSFVKTEQPSSNGVSAPKITLQNEIPYLEFTPSVITDNKDFKSKLNFWNQLDTKYGYDFVRQVPLPYPQ